MSREANTMEILLVEDDEGDAKAVLRAFKKANCPYPIHRAMDGLEALDRLDELQFPKDIILLVDINMPRMNGIELINAIRENENLKKLIVFVLTTSKSDEDIAKAYEKNIAGYITKSKMGEEFQKLTNLINNYQEIVELPR